MKKKILIVDDIEMFLRINRALLEPLSSHFDFIEAKSGVDAIDKTTVYRPALILMDYEMPPPHGTRGGVALNGIEAARTIKRGFGTLAPKIILITNEVDETDVDRSVVDGFIRKQEAPKKLLLLVKETLGIA